MTTIYISSKTKKKLRRVIERSRVSSDFGARKKYPNFNRIIEFLVDLAEKYPLEYLETLANLSNIEGEMPIEIYDNPEAKEEYIRREIEEENHA